MLNLRALKLQEADYFQLALQKTLNKPCKALFLFIFRYCELCFRAGAGTHARLVKLKALAVWASQSSPILTQMQTPTLDGLS